MTNNYGNLALHFTAWKKGPLDCMKLLLQVFPEGAAQKNNHGNLPLHYAAHYNAPIEVVEALYHAYPDAARQKNNDSNTPLDLAVADGASNNVVALLQGKSVPPNDEEIFEGAKNRCERVEKELQRVMESHDSVQEDMEVLLGFLMDVKENHPSAMYSSGIDPEKCGDVESLLEQASMRISLLLQHVLFSHTFHHASNSKYIFISHLSQVRIAGEEEQKSIEEDEVKQIEDSLVPPDDPVEVQLAQIIGLDAIKNQVRGLRRTIEVERLRGLAPGESVRPRHFALTGNPGCGKTYAARLLLPLMYKIGAATTESIVEVGRDDLVDARSEERTIEKTMKVLERAKGGVLFIDEVYTLLPSHGRQGSQDHGPAALKVLSEALPQGDPLIILAGYSLDLQKVVSSDIGFKGRFLLRMELPDPTPFELARMVASKLGRKGFVLGEGLTARYIADAITSMGAEWRMERNGRVADDLVHAIKLEVRRKATSGNDLGTLSPAQSSRMPIVMPDEITITVEDFQNAFRNGI
jgi:SpoVK/Ycf46/Vps4 family AAA+-type ATPase